MEEAQAKQNLANRLTRREQTILQLLTKGYTNQDIADALNISYRTAKNAVSSVLQKLGARHRTEAAIFGIRERDRERNELIRKIVQACASCTDSKGLGWFCNRKRSQCRERVKKWLKELDEL